MCFGASYSRPDPCERVGLTIACASVRLLQALKPHQVEGVQWLLGAFDRGGGLLTDEPGLGKTLQLIALPLSV